MRVLVTGGRGVLGEQVVARLTRAGFMPRVMSRVESNAASVEWTRADLETGAGLADAVKGIDTIIHCATSPTRATKKIDVLGTEKLLAAARAAKISHFIYISIVGIDRIPLAYYQSKHAAEKAIEQGDLPYTIVRATQFYDLIDKLLCPVARFPIAFLPTDFQFQPIDEGECAARLVELVRAGVSGNAPDIAGPHVMRLGELARAWLIARGKSQRIVHLPVPGKIAAGYRNGFNTAPQNQYGKITWREWLARKY